MKKIAMILVTASSLSLGGQLWAHHSSSMYDVDHKVLIEGTVSQFKWVNPHSWLWMKVPDGKGGEDDYALECGSIAQLLQIGWTRAAVKPGDKVKIVGALRRDGVKRGEVFTLITSDGKHLQNRVGY
jgi:hypothetical protein